MIWLAHAVKVRVKISRQFEKTDSEKIDFFLDKNILEIMLQLSLVLLTTHRIRLPDKVGQFCPNITPHPDP